MYQRGDIVLVPFPFTDLRTTKRRPALIISNEMVNATGDVIIVMITSQNKNDVFQIEIDITHVSPSLPKTSFVRCHRVATIDVNLIMSLIGHANNTLLDSVIELVKHLLNDHNVSNA